MSFTDSVTYIYAYMAFAVIYLVGSIVSATSALRVSNGISHAPHTAEDAAPPSAVIGDAIGHGQRLLDYTQVATLLPLIYIVGSMFLGSFIAKDTGLARSFNVIWIAFTLICAAAAIILSILALREAQAMRSISGGTWSLGRGHTPEALQKVGLRLGVSAALLLLVAVFIMLNLWSVAGNMGTLSSTGFLL
ncbi:MAG: hypothetical protein XD74_1617 [Actinobacteria bacterium 66_15]|nr:MAG: hypothetical protein XD74_1617 [Actinobacteria bacterium 66_15]